MRFLREKERKKKKKKRPAGSPSLQPAWPKVRTSENAGIHAGPRWALTQVQKEVVFASCSFNVAMEKMTHHK